MKTLIIFFFLPLQLLSQDITGIWTGHIRTSGNDLPYEIVISSNKEKLSGYSLMTFSINGNQSMGIKSISLKNRNGRISLEDGELIYNSFSTPPKRVKLSGELSLAIHDSVMSLNGNFRTRSIDFRSDDNLSYAGTIDLVRQKVQTKTRLILMLDKLNLLNTLSFLEAKQGLEAKASNGTTADEDNQSVVISKNTKVLAPGMTNLKGFAGGPQLRKIDAGAGSTLAFPKPNMDSLMAESIIAASKERRTDIVRSVYFKSDSLILSLYDNGIVDGDSVSVVLNGKVIIANQGLTTKPIRLIVHVTPELGDSLLFTMIAENLGTIPPNTGLLIVEDGDDRNEIRFTGDMQMSSAVLFRRKH
jgi:hypothetical protein